MKIPIKKLGKVVAVGAGTRLLAVVPVVGDAFNAKKNALAAVGVISIVCYTCYAPAVNKVENIWRLWACAGGSVGTGVAMDKHKHLPEAPGIVRNHKPAKPNFRPQPGIQRQGPRAPLVGPPPGLN
jgi:hypothetical protein